MKGSEVAVTNRRAVEAALAHISDIDAAGELPLMVRRNLTESLTLFIDNGTRTRRFTASLGLACAKAGWPVWESAFVSESRPMDLAEAATSSIENNAEAKEVLVQDLLEVKAYLDNKFLLGRRFFPAIYAGFAAWAVARDVLSWGRANSSESGNSELQMSPEEWDPCFLASLAITGGATWEGVGNIDRRREFWSWYLTIAVPEAFAVAVKQ